jgi:hypothetical protein
MSHSSSNAGNEKYRSYFITKGMYIELTNKELYKQNLPAENSIEYLISKHFNRYAQLGIGYPESNINGFFHSFTFTVIKDFESCINGLVKIVDEELSKVKIIDEELSKVQK